MDRFIKFLRSQGGFWNYVATFVSLITTNWAVAMSTVIAFTTSLWQSALQWVQQPSVYVFAGVFLFSLWTLIGISTLRGRNKPILVRGVQDYAYGLIQEGITEISLGIFPQEHHHAGLRGLNITFGFRNVSNGILLLKTEELRVIVNGRTSEDTTAVEMILPKFAVKSVRAAGVLVDVPSKGTGTITLKVVYGHPDEKPTRKYTLRLKAQFAFSDEPDKCGLQTEVIEDNDEPI